MYDRNNYYEMIQRELHAEFLDIIERPDTIRDNKHISLYETVSFNYLDLATPILYFVDTFISLFENQLWFDLRNIEYDLVIDRHGNIIRLQDIADKKC